MMSQCSMLDRVLNRAMWSMLCQSVRFIKEFSMITESRETNNDFPDYSTYTRIISEMPLSKRPSFNRSHRYGRLASVLPVFYPLPSYSRLTSLPNNFAFVQSRSTSTLFLVLKHMFKYALFQKI